MLNEIIHLKTKVNFQQQQDIDESKIIINKFIEACNNLDVSIFEPYMDEDKDVFEDKEKYRFLERLHGIFEEYRRVTFDDFLVTNTPTICNGCSQGKRVQQFKIYGVEQACIIGEFGYVIEVKDGFLKDIYLCFSYE